LLIYDSIYIENRYMLIYIYKYTISI